MFAPVRNRRTQPRTVTFLDGANTPDNNASASAHFINGLQSMQVRADLSAFRECRLYLVRRNAAATAGYTVELMYTTAYEGTASNFLTIGVSAVSIDADFTQSSAVTSWTRLLPAARSNVIICPIATGGDGVVDPNFGIVAAEFR